MTRKILVEEGKLGMGTGGKQIRKVDNQNDAIIGEKETKIEQMGKTDGAQDNK